MTNRIPNVHEAIRKAEALLPGVPVNVGEDPRWQAIIDVGVHLESEPQAVWECIRRWGSNPQNDFGECADPENAKKLEALCRRLTTTRHLRGPS